MSQAVLDGVRDLLPTLRERADECERLRVVPEASIKELEETGFFTLLQPRRFGGLESDPIDFYTSVRDIASACGAGAECGGCSLRIERLLAAERPVDLRVDVARIAS